MIIKQFVPRKANNAREKAGVRAEEQMAHYLDRYFADSARFFVLHDLRLELDGQVAQIDHLIVHQFGVAIVESKSVSSVVRINSAGEWERDWNRSWTGMPDPILQGERQGRLLKRLLESRQAELLDKLLLGTLQGTFTHMAVDVFAAISDQGRIVRAAKQQAPNAKKADAIPNAIEETIKQHKRNGQLLGGSLVALAKAPRDFNKAECLRIARFLHAQHRALNEPVPVEAQTVAVSTAAPQSAVDRLSDRTVTAVCKECGSHDLDARIGKYGPYGKCRACGNNTKIQVSCENCHTDVYLRREGAGFRGACDTCGQVVRVQVA